MGNWMYGVYLDRSGFSGQLMPHSIEMLARSFTNMGVSYPHFTALVFSDLYRRGEERHANLFGIIEELEKGEWLYNSMKDGLYNAVVKGCCNPHLKGKMGKRQDIVNAICSMNWEFTEMDVSEVDPAKAVGLKRSWIAKSILSLLDEYTRLHLNVEPQPYERTPDDILDGLKRDGYNRTLRRYIEYIPRSKMVKAGQVLKPAKILRAAFPNVDKDIISAAAGFIADELKANGVAVLDDYTFLESGDISEVYQITHTSTGTLGQSCMRREDRKFFEIYDYYMPNTTILYVTDEYGYLLGRALLHTGVTSRDHDGEFNIMDRIYYSDQDVLAAFKAWAKANGYYRKLEQRLDENNYVSPDGEILCMPMIGVECRVINEGEFDCVPYVDTFAYYCTQDPHWLWSGVDRSIAKSSDWHGLKITEGYDEEGFFTKQTGAHTCNSCGRSLSSDEINMGTDEEEYCDHCFNESFRECGICHQVHDADESTFVDREDIDVCPDCYKREFRKCALCGEHIRKVNAKDFINKDGEDAHICKECAAENDRVCECSHCDALIDERATTTVHVGVRDEEWCPECVDDNATQCFECDEYFPDEDVMPGLGNRQSKKYCAECHCHNFGYDEDDIPEPKVLCRCVCKMKLYDTYGEAYYVQKMCMSDSREFQDCKKKLTEGDIKAVHSPYPVECNHCHQEVKLTNLYGHYTNVMDEEGHVYHEECYEEMRKSKPHPCEVCNNHHCNVYSLLGEDMCEKCIMKKREGIDRWKRNLFLSTVNLPL